MSTSFSFTEEQLAQIALFRTDLKNPENASKPAGAIPLYSYIFQCITIIGVRVTFFKSHSDPIFLFLASILGKMFMPKELAKVNQGGFYAKTFPFLPARHSATYYSAWQ